MTTTDKRSLDTGKRKEKRKKDEDKNWKQTFCLFFVTSIFLSLYFVFLLLTIFCKTNENRLQCHIIVIYLLMPILFAASRVSRRCSMSFSSGDVFSGVLKLQDIVMYSMIMITNLVCYPTKQQ